VSWGQFLPAIAGALVAVVAVSAALYVIITNRWPRVPRAWVTYQCKECPRRFDDLSSLMIHEVRTHVRPEDHHG
jgi:hypothetical protein